LREIGRIVTVILLLSTASVIVQVATPAEPRTVSQVVDFWVTNTEQLLLLPAADAMPEAKYSFAPSNGEFSGVRTFAEQVKHLAAANYQLAAATGRGAAAGTDHETAPESVKTKAQVMGYLKGSFTTLHRAAAALNENNMDDPIQSKVRSKGNRTRLLMLINALVHSSNHYRQMVDYLRMNNIVPPASR
jgi:DinB superfamily